MATGSKSDIESVDSNPFHHFVSLDISIFTKIWATKSRRIIQFCPAYSVFDENGLQKIGRVRHEPHVKIVVYVTNPSEKCTSPMLKLKHFSVRHEDKTISSTEVIAF